MSGNAVSTAPEGRHRYGLRVYYEDTDAAGIVYHANYLRFAERARTEALRDLGIPHAAMLRECNLMFVVRRVKVDYLHPARLDDSLVVVTEPVAVRGATMALRQEVQGPEGPCAVVEVELACVSPDGNRPARIPPRWRGHWMRCGRRCRPVDKTWVDREWVWWIAQSMR